MALVAVVSPRATAAEGDVTGYEVPSLASLPHGVARGSDGAIWFTERFADKIGRLHDGAFSEFALPQAGSDPTAIVSGPDGSLWFVEQGTDQIGRITTEGGLREFPLPSGTTPVGIASGPDGALWFTERDASRIGRITADGVTLSEWPTLTANASPTGIVAGPDGALWFTERGASKLGRITTDGTMTEFHLPAGSLPTSIATGPDENLWVSLRGSNSIGRVSSFGLLEAAFPIPSVGAQPSHIVAGPQGAMWFTETATAKVAKITTGGQITEYPLAAGAAPQGITEGADGAPWFAESNANRIARLELGGPIDTTAPTIVIRDPLTGTPFVLGQQTPAAYACTDEPGGSGVEVCEGPVADGAPIPTESLGGHAFTVQAVDMAGNPNEASTSYLVFRSIDGSLLEPSPRPGAWLALSLGMDLDPRGTDPLATATTHEVTCGQGEALGDEEPAAVHTRVARDGTLEIRWNTERSWTGSCRRLTLTFSSQGWGGVPATFLVSWDSAARR